MKNFSSFAWIKIGLLFSVLLAIQTPKAATQQFAQISPEHAKFELKLNAKKDTWLIALDLCLPANAYRDKSTRQKITTKIFANEVIKQQAYLLDFLQTSLNLTVQQSIEQLVLLSSLYSDISITKNDEQYGNDVCLISKLTAPINKSTNLSDVLPMVTGSEIHFSGSSEEFVRKVSMHLSTLNILTDDALILSSSQPIAKFQDNGQPSVYRVFDTQQYIKMLKQKFATVFVSAEPEYINAISAFLSEQGFEVVKNKSDAHWHLKASVDILKGKWLNMSVTLETKTNQYNFKNDPQAIAIDSLKSSGLLQKAINYHLTLMGLSRQMVSVAPN